MLGVEVLRVVILALGNDVHQGDCNEDATGERVRDAEHFWVLPALAEPERKHPTHDSLDKQNENRGYLEPEIIFCHQINLLYFKYKKK
jgi:hypothetical protein